MLKTAPRPGSSLAQWLDYQGRNHIQLMDLSLERVRQVAERMRLLGLPWLSAIVGGTNGKGSTATLLSAMLQARGRTVGLFTSPHLVRYEERIRVGGVEAGAQELVCAFERIEALRDDVPLTPFEWCTLAALEVFRARAVDTLVLEVGLGGRLDATNIIDAQVAVLCSVGFDHKDWLGDTLEAIGTEKSGIFRSGRAVVLGSADMPNSVWHRIGELHCRPMVAAKDFTWTVAADGRWDYRSEQLQLAGLPAPAMSGNIQYRNAATALTAARQLVPVTTADFAAVATAVQGAVIPGRLQVVPGAIEWILDVAHNEPAAQVLAHELSLRPCHGKTWVVFSLLADKDLGAVVRALDPIADHWVVTGIVDPRGVAADELAQRMPPVRGTVVAVDGIVESLLRARESAAAGDRVVVLGSHQIVGPALSALGLY